MESFCFSFWSAALKLERGPVSAHHSTSYLKMDILAQNILLETVVKSVTTRVVTQSLPKVLIKMYVFFT